MARNFRELQDKMSPEHRAEVEKRVQETLAAMRLDGVREAREMTQVQLAEILHVSQGAVSKVERRADMYISTLRSYVRAMGGDMQIRAVFPDGEVIINQFSDLDRTDGKTTTEFLASRESTITCDSDRNESKVLR